MKQSFLANDTIKNIIEGAIKRKVKILPAAAYTEEYYQAEDLGKDSQNPTVMPHYDVPYHSYKAFFYLDDVDEGNGVFHYSIGSHRFNLRRLILEYFTSINVSAKKTPQVNYNDSKHLGTYKEAMIPMIGKKNTLIIFDAMGIHKRGSFSTTKPRRMVQLYYRSVDSKANTYRKLIDRIISA